jgi:hypothetical protein
VRTIPEKHTQRLHVRLTASEVAALDFLAFRWDTTRSGVVRGMIVGAALAQLDRLDALDAIEPSFDALVDVPSIDDVLAAP